MSRPAWRVGVMLVLPAFLACEQHWSHPGEILPAEVGSLEQGLGAPARLYSASWAAAPTVYLLAGHGYFVAPNSCSGAGCGPDSALLSTDGTSTGTVDLYDAYTAGIFGVVGGSLFFRGGTSGGVNSYDFNIMQLSPGGTAVQVGQTIGYSPVGIDAAVTSRYIAWVEHIEWGGPRWFDCPNMDFSIPLVKISDGSTVRTLAGSGSIFGDTERFLRAAGANGVFYEEGICRGSQNYGVAFISYGDINGAAFCFGNATSLGSVAVLGDSLFAAGTLDGASGNYFFYCGRGGTAGQLQTVSWAPLWASSDGTKAFISNTDTNGAELWVGPTFHMVKDINPGSAGSNPSALVVLGSQWLFTADDGTHGRELWRTDATTAGTQLVADINPGSNGSSVSFLAQGSGFWLLTADDGTHGPELWRTDGTAAGTTLVADINPGAAGSSIASLQQLGSLWYFVADDGTHGPEPWVTDGTSADTRLLADVNPGSTGSGATAFTLWNGAVYFAASNGTSGLWRTDGTPAGTALVKGLSPATFSAMALTSDPGHLFFTTVGHPAAPTSTSKYPWLTDGTSTGTVPLEAVPTIADPTVAGMLGNNLVLSTSSAVWSVPIVTAPSLSCGDVTAEATSAAGAAVTYPAAQTSGFTPPVSVTYSTASGSAFALGVTTVTGTATDGSGDSATCSFKVTVSDTTAPAVTCPANKTVEATGSDGAVVTYTVTATDAVTASPTITSTPASGTKFPMGQTTVTATAKDAAGNQSTCSFKVTVSDTTAPTITCPADMVAEATGADGATVTYSVQASDPVSTPTVTSTPVSGSKFALGQTTVTATAKDAAGNQASCSFKVTVHDTTPPLITCPANMTLEATSASGVVGVFTVQATDAVSLPTITSTPASGATFALGQTTVTSTAKDAAGNQSSCTFKITVRDTTAPVITCPSDFAAEATGPDGAVVTYTITATDAVTASPTITNSPASGTKLPMGQTTVSATAKDAAGNQSSCSFKVTVRDTTPPAITCPTDISINTTDASGAVATYTVTATDAVTASPTIASSPASGTKFPLGTNTVNATATDAAGNVGRCSFRVIVVQTSVPTIICPADVTTEATGPTGAVVTYAAAQTSGFTGTPSVTYTVASGTRFGLGTTSVGATATDGSSHSASCTFKVIVRDTTPPTITCPSDSRVEATSANGAAVAFAVQATDAVSTPAVTTDHASGSMFALGRTLVTATAKDSAGNTSTCSFAVTVQDTTPPALTCPADMTVEATGSDGAAVAFMVPATDAVSTPTMTITPPSGSKLPLGRTSVAVVAMDAAGNRATCSFLVTVQDTTPPRLTCPSDLTVEATGPDGAIATYAPAAVDAVSTPTVTTTPASGSKFAMGTASVTASATDAAGNRATCSFHVTVRDTTAPTIVCPADIVAEATGPDGAVVQFQVHASDAVGVTSVTSDHASGAEYPQGQTSVTATASDAAGNHSSCTFKVTVRDSTPPSIACPGDQVIEATGPSGAAATFAATATDLVSTPQVSCVPASGSTFALGATTVTATATDAAGNSASCTFQVTVRDTTTPVVTCPADIVAEATSPEGAVVTFEASASDAVSTPQIAYSPASGGTYSMGETSVTATATDAAGNSSSCAFTVTVQDTTPPTLKCPVDIVAEATGPQGAIVDFAPESTDAASTPDVSSQPPSGSMFALGTTTVQVDATDGSGNKASCQFDVKVQDTTPPTLTCPETVTVSADQEQRIQLSDLSIEAGDTVSSVKLTETTSTPAGAPQGESLLTVTATDAAGNESQCQVLLIVKPGALGGCAAGEADGLALLLPVLASVVRPRRPRTAGRGA